VCVCVCECERKRMGVRKREGKSTSMCKNKGLDEKVGNFLCVGGVA